jgi:hypothetical protein
MKKFIIAIIVLNLLFSCNDDENKTIIEVTTEDFENTINENPAPMQEIGNVIGSSNNGDVIFEIESQNPEGAFSIDAESGLLMVADATKFDFELNTVITGIIKVSNENVFMNTNITININDIEDSMLTVENFNIQIDENPQPNQILGSILATTDQGTLLFSIENQEPEGAFQINNSTGELSVDEETLFDFELNENITGVIKVSNQNIDVFANVTIALNDVPDIIVTTSDFEITINEGPSNQEILGIVEGSTNQGALTYTILEQYPENAFSIDTNSGELRVENTGLFNYEVYPIVSGIVEVANGDVSATATITINLLDIEENDLLLSSMTSTFNRPNFDVCDQNHTMNYANGEINSWFNYFGVKSYNMSFVSSNSLITNYNKYIVDQGAICDFQYTITYDNSDRIVNIGLIGEECDFYLNYNMEYNGDTVNFIDQINSNHKSIILNNDNQILNYTKGSYSIEFTYDGENLISMLNNNGNIGGVTFEYDNYRNPFRLNETLNFSQIQCFINVMRGDFLLSDRANNFLRNTNNITRLVRSNIPLGIEINYSYNYNSDDYPINKTMDAGNGVVEYFYD